VSPTSIVFTFFISLLVGVLCEFRMHFVSSKEGEEVGAHQASLG